MATLTGSLVLVGLVLILAGTIVQKLRFRRQIIGFEVPLAQSPPFSATIVPHVKHSLTFKVPRSIRTDESAVIELEYFQGVTYFFFEELHTFLYDTLEVIPRSLPSGLRAAFFAATSTGQLSADPRLRVELAIRLSSSRIEIAPEGWQSRPNGSKVPCLWRWDISCQEPGQYSLLCEPNQELIECFPNMLNSAQQVNFQIRVRPPIGISHKVANTIRVSGAVTGTLLVLLGTLIAANPSLQRYISNILDPFLVR